MNTLASKHTTYAAPLNGFVLSWRALPLLTLVAAVATAVVMATLTVALDGDDRWAELLAAVGIVTTVVALGVLLGTAQGWANGTRMSLASLSAAVVGLGAIALAGVAYLGGFGDARSVPSVSVSDEGAALASQETNNNVQPPGYAHDLGRQPSVTEFLEMDNATVLANVPGGTLLPNEVDALRSELAAARQFALEHNTIEKALEAGYFIATNDVPFMGAHLIHRGYLLDGVFDAGKPEGMLFSKLGDPDGEWQLVGVWYLLIPGQGGATVDSPPEGFTGNLDLWHAHYGLCTRAGVISENNTEEGCRADNGRWIGDLRWMMHAWVYPESGVDNSDGVFVYLNEDLFDAQQGHVQGQPLGGGPAPD